MEPAPEQHVPEILFFKNRLQEHAQKSSLPLPLYETVNEGPPHAPRFRSTVTVNGIRYRSVHTFPHRKEAEQDAARIALENIPTEVKLEGFPQIFKETMFCKSIVNEFAAKRKLPLPRYNTTQLGMALPAFTSFLSFDGKTFTGRLGRNKKEAEQLAARAAIQSIIGDSSYGMAMVEILHSKAKMYAALKFDSPISNEHRATPVASLANAPNTDTVLPLALPTVVPLALPTVVPLALPCATQAEVQAEQGSTPSADQPIGSDQVETVGPENGNPGVNTSQYENHVAQVQTAGAGHCSSIPVVPNVVFKKQRKLKKKAC